MVGVVWMLKAQDLGGREMYGGFLYLDTRFERVRIVFLSYFED